MTSRVSPMLCVVGRSLRLCLQVTGSKSGDRARSLVDRTPTHPFVWFASVCLGSLEKRAMCAKARNDVLDHRKLNQGMFIRC